MKPEQMKITTERIDDIVLLINVMKKQNLPGIIDQHIPRHHLQQGLSWGWVATIWLAHILSQGDHRKVTVRDWVEQARHTLQQITGMEIRETDFTDDRLSLVLKELSKLKYWQPIEEELSQSTIRAYEIEQKQVRVDATTVSGYHEGGEQSLFQFGNSKDNPALRQVKLMMGTLDPLGFPLVTDVVSGEKADDPLYIPCVERILKSLPKKNGVLIVGDCKLSATATRAYIEKQKCYYLTPLAMVGTVGADMNTWISDALDGKQPLQEFEIIASDGRTQQINGYEITRQCQCVMEDQPIEWEERVLIVHSPTYAHAQRRGLEKRLENAKEKILALTPSPGRGKRQITDDAQLHAAIEKILAANHVEGLIRYTTEIKVENSTRFIGKGRGGKNRPQQTIQKERCQVTDVTIDMVAVESLIATYGWRAYATNAPEEVTLEKAVLTYRDEWLIERCFHRLKGAPLSLNPIYVKKDEQAMGLIHLLTIAVRLLTLIEFVVRRSLNQQEDSLIGLHKENPKKANSAPTTERLLQAFSKIDLTIIHLPDQTICHVTPLSDLQTKILYLLGFSSEIYTSLTVI
jgi:transposase